MQAEKKSRGPVGTLSSPGQVSAKTARAWSRIAGRTMKKAAEEFAKDSAEKSEKPVVARRRGTHVALSR